MNHNIVVIHAASNLNLCLQYSQSISVYNTVSQFLLTIQSVNFSFSSAGLKESPRMPLSESALLTEVMDECRKQVGVVFNQDSQ